MTKTKLILHDDKKEKFQSHEAEVEGFDVGYGATSEEAVSELLNILKTNRLALIDIIFDIENQYCEVVGRGNNND